MAEEEATPAEENAEATEATEATGDAAAEAPAEEAPKQQSVWLPIMASSVISIAGAFALFQFVLGPKLVKGLANALDTNGTLQAHAGHGEGGEGHDDHGKGSESGGGHGEGDGGHELASITTLLVIPHRWPRVTIHMSAHCQAMRSRWWVCWRCPRIQSRHLPA